MSGYRDGGKARTATVLETLQAEYQRLTDEAAGVAAAIAALRRAGLVEREDIDRFVCHEVNGKPEVHRDWCPVVTGAALACNCGVMQQRSVAGEHESWCPAVETSAACQCGRGRR